MSGEGIPEDIKYFITAHISSVGNLEVLLLLASDAQVEWSAERVFQELRTNLSYALEQLEELTRLGLLKKNKDRNTYQYQPNIEQEKILNRLFYEYSLRRSAVIAVIYDKPMDKIRSFADAFKIKKG